MSEYIWRIEHGDGKSMKVEVVEDGMALEFRVVGYGPPTDMSFRVKLAERFDIYQVFPYLKDKGTLEVTLAEIKEATQ